MLGVVFGAWWRIETRAADREKATNDKIASVHASAALVQSQLAEHKLHVAETYITKAGLRETTEQIMDAINDVRQQMTALNTRLDRFIEERPQRSGRDV